MNEIEALKAKLAKVQEQKVKADLEMLPYLEKIIADTEKKIAMMEVAAANAAPVAPSFEDYWNDFENALTDYIVPEQKNMAELIKKYQEEGSTAKAAAMDYAKVKQLKKKNAPKPAKKKASTPPARKAKPKPKAPTAAKKTAPKKAPATKAKATSKKTVKKKVTTPKLNWRTKVSKTFLEEKEVKDIELGCEFRALVVKEKTILDLKTIANPGDTILLTHEGYPFTVLTPNGAKNRCVKPVTAATSSTKPKTSSKKTASKPSTTKKAKPSVSKSTKTAAPKKAKASPAKSTKTKTTKSSQSCTTETWPRSVPAPLLVWMTKEAEDYKAKRTTLKIEKVRWMANTGKLLVTYQETDYFKFPKAVQKYVCPDTGETTTPRGTPETCTRDRWVVKKNSRKIKALYSKSNRSFMMCETWLNAAYGLCSKNKDCSEAKRKMYREKYYGKCGDYLAKERRVKFLKAVYAQTRKERKSSEKYYTAFSRVWNKLRAKIA